MEEINPLFLAVAGVGLAMGIVRFIQLMVWGINASAFDHAIERLLAAGNRDRALKLCSAAPSSGYVAVIRAMVTKSAELSPKEGEGLVHGALADAYKSAHEQQTQRMGKLGLLPPLSVLIAGGASFIPLHAADAPPYAQYFPAGFALFLAILSWRRVRRFEADCQRGRDKMLPLLTAYVMRRDA